MLVTSKVLLRTPFSWKIKFHQGHVTPRALTIYTIHPSGNFRGKYSVLQLFQTQNGKIRKCITINIGKFKRKRTNALIKLIAYNF